ncbi:hypothetical protein LCGC14_0294660 [marine sediment metagenome]|uniref:Uncharacterized protein n=1 Tax=marine sediment metagenome TaxID=412755 RepID=A0A0F9WXT8_9ZZZZ
MRLPKKITAQYLRNKKACEEEVEQFTRVFPNGAEVTRANVIKAQRAKLDLDWFIGSVTGTIERFDEEWKVLYLRCRNRQIGKETYHKAVRELEREHILTAFGVK